MEIPSTFVDKLLNLDGHDGGIMDSWCNSSL